MRKLYAIGLSATDYDPVKGIDFSIMLAVSVTAESPEDASVEARRILDNLMLSTPLKVKVISEAEL